MSKTSVNNIDKLSGELQPVGNNTGLNFSGITKTATDAFNGVTAGVVGFGTNALGTIRNGIDTASSFVGNLFGGGKKEVDDITKDAKLDNITDPASATTGSGSNLVDRLSQVEIIRRVSEDRQQTANQFLEQNKFAARLVSTSNGDKVVFKSSPTNLSESRMVVYRPMDIVHLPGNYQIYSHTNPRNWSMNVKLFSRNGVEAEENLATITMLKSWTMPYFGNSKTSGVGKQRNSEAYEAELLGAPPDVLKFTAYSDATSPGFANIRNVPVVLINLEIPYPEDVDYIQTSVSKVPFPTVMQVAMTLVEVRSPSEYRKFNIVDYKNGNLIGW